MFVFSPFNRLEKSENVCVSVFLCVRETNHNLEAMKWIQMKTRNRCLWKCHFRCESPQRDINLKLFFHFPTSIVLESYPINRKWNVIQIQTSLHNDHHKYAIFIYLCVWELLTGTAFFILFLHWLDFPLWYFIQYMRELSILWGFNMCMEMKK